MRCTEIRPSRQRENGITGCTNSIRHDFKPLQTLLLFARAVGQSSIRLTTFGNGKELNRFSYPPPPCRPCTVLPSLLLLSVVTLFSDLYLHALCMARRRRRDYKPKKMKTMEIISPTAPSKPSLLTTLEGRLGKKGVHTLFAIVAVVIFASITNAVVFGENRLSTHASKTANDDQAQAPGDKAAAAWPTRESVQKQAILSQLRSTPLEKYSDLTATIFKTPEESFQLLSTTTKPMSRFTQGLEYHPASGMMLESVGHYHRSNIFAFPYPSEKSTPTTPPISPPFNHFNEGITYLPETSQIVMVTWKERTGTVFNVSQVGGGGGDWENVFITKDRTFQYTSTTGEGWGLAYNGQNKIAVSDGSSYIQYWDSATFTESDSSSRIRVHTIDDAGEKRYIERINELEYYQGDLLANVWFTDQILRIDTVSGLVKVLYDFRDLYPKREREPGTDVFNGIAAMEDGSLVVTGKQWTKYYRVKLED